MHTLAVLKFKFGLGLDFVFDSVRFEQFVFFFIASAYIVSLLCSAPFLGRMS